MDPIKCANHCKPVHIKITLEKMQYIFIFMYISIFYYFLYFIIFHVPVLYVLREVSEYICFENLKRQCTKFLSALFSAANSDIIFCLQNAQNKMR